MWLLFERGQRNAGDKPLDFLDGQIKDLPSGPPRDGYVIRVEDFYSLLAAIAQNSLGCGENADLARYAELSRQQNGRALFSKRSRCRAARPGLLSQLNSNSKHWAAWLRHALQGHAGRELTFKTVTSYLLSQRAFAVKDNKR